MLDIDGYQDKYITVWDRVEVAIVGRYVENGMLKDFGKWVTSDENGYFYLANLPAGEYALKGLRAHLFGDEVITILDYTRPKDKQEYELAEPGPVVLHGMRYDVNTSGRIINFQHNIFRLMRSGLVDFKRVKRIRNYRMAAGEELDVPPVPVYFVETFPESEWTNYLNIIMK